MSGDEGRAHVVREDVTNTNMTGFVGLFKYCICVFFIFALDFSEHHVYFVGVVHETSSSFTTGTIRS